MKSKIYMNYLLLFYSKLLCSKSRSYGSHVLLWNYTNCRQLNSLYDTSRSSSDKIYIHFGKYAFWIYQKMFFQWLCIASSQDYYSQISKLFDLSDLLLPCVEDQMDELSVVLKVTDVLIGTSYVISVKYGFMHWVERNNEMTIAKHCSSNSSY